MSLAVESPAGATASAQRRGVASRPDLWLGLALAAALILLAFTTTGGEIESADAPNTWAQIVLVLVGAGLGGAVLIAGARGRAWGAGALWLFGALAGLTFLSMAWSVQPAFSWLAANGTLSYLAAFASALAFARLFPERWRALIGALAVYAVVVSAYALVTKAFPAAFGAAGNFSRLRAPFDYFNAAGLVAAMGLPAWLWFSGRAGRVAPALSVPALGTLVSALVLSYGRGALAAAVIGLAVWFALVPGRLRSALVLACAAVVGGLVSVWASARHSLTGDHVPLSVRVGAGHSFGLVLIGALVFLVLVGVAVAVAMERVRMSAEAKRRIGFALLVGLALVPVAVLVGLAASSRGFGGEVSHLWTSLTSPKSGAPNSASRITDLGSSRPRYWGDGLKVGDHAVLAGTGAFGFATACWRYASDCVPDAHSYLVQTFADLGVIGVALSLALLVAWGLAVRRTLRAPGAAGERAGLITLLTVALIFGIHSTIDWTWFIPGVAVPALLCAGWLVGRGPLDGAVGRLKRARTVASLRGVGALGLCAAALACAWVIWQPLRASDATASAIAAMTAGNLGGAVTDARTAVNSDPFDTLARETLSLTLGNQPAARQTLADGTSLEPSNPETWLALGQFDATHGRMADARMELSRAHALEPRSDWCTLLAARGLPASLCQP